MNADLSPLPIVVGVDGSEQSKAALAWSGRYARLAAVPLKVLLAWHIPTNYDWTPPLPETWNPESDARTVLEREVKEVLGSDPDVELSTLVVEGHPAQVLTEASKHASLVVVGSRGRGQFAGMLLGSVSEFLTTHAHCPVLIVRDETEA
jgi:nucleotide-binding universal stress UspA family protein